MAKFVAISNFKFNGKVFTAGDSLPEKGADGKPFLAEKDLKALLDGNHVQDESKITAQALGELEARIGRAKAELSAAQKELDAKKAELAKLKAE